MKKDKNVYDSVLTSTYCRIFESELANGETFFFGRHSKQENLTMFPLKFEHGAQVSPKKCAMQRASDLKNQFS